MEQCPVCGAYMNFNMTYFCGNPVIYYRCSCCGYDSRNTKSYATSTIPNVPFMYEPTRTTESINTASFDQIKYSTKTNFYNADSVFG